MTRFDIARRIAAKNGISIEAADRIILDVMNVISDSVAEGGNVYLRGFGTFTTISRAPRKGHYFNEKEGRTIPATVVPAFMPSPDFKKKVSRQ